MTVTSAFRKTLLWKEDDAMVETMIASQTQSEMTDGQIDETCAKLRAALNRHRKEISSDAAQLALGTGNIGMRIFAPFREQVEMFSEMIVREVDVDYDIPPEEAIHATKRAEYSNNEVVATIPRDGKGKKRVRVYFFPLRKLTSVKDVQKLLKQHGLKPDPYAVAAVNKADLAFADIHPNGTQWVDSNGNHRCAIFHRWCGGRCVFVHRHEPYLNAFWWVG